MRKTAMLLLAGSLATTPIASANEAYIESTFFPYKDGFPTHDVATPGAVIDASNVDQASDVLDEAMIRFIKDGWTTIRVGEPFDIVLHEKFIDATRQHSAGVSLGDNPGEIFDFVAGRPFPAPPSLDDPRAGEKLAWNFRYSFNAGDGATIEPFHWTFRDMKSGKIQRQLKFRNFFYTFKHRVVQDPVPEVENNPSDLYRAQHLIVKEPLDVKDTQLLLHRFDDDLKRDNAWLYLGFQRRVRRLGTGQVTDAFLGSDIMIEDFEGYNARISDMNWEYKGDQVMLLPFFKHNDQPKSGELTNDPDGFDFIEHGGKGNCFANVEHHLRKVHVVEQTPKDPNHPVGRRLYYQDVQTGKWTLVLIYDRKGDLWKAFRLGTSHPEHHLPQNKDSGVALDDSVVMIDVQAQRCTTLQFKNIVSKGEISPNQFTVQTLRKVGR